ncbi:UDP-N-acetylmuramoyl-L-alanine--D-glutamate ligase [Alkalihalophilus pseudofirmus]|uniref:UDP-N-acetylmuramoyl-L-alanine--D-glutamate ligase n=1 Tax=Alkalihalophilus pseudofirmus TaxID=79885 RepID=UPI000952E47E|nr:UDP-N-acetylmuramoyl-L-alanine--D-glutamate ligase [Alkalihalophilus pseudofirmus]
MKNTEMYRGKNVLVLGLAKSGEAAALLLHELGAKVIVNDAKSYDENDQAKALEKKGIKVVCGEHPLSLLDQELECVVKNPGIPYHNPIVKEAVRRNIPVITEVELTSALSEADMIAITGSNGKTTTTTLIHEMLKKSAKNPLIAGNIGTVSCDVVKGAASDDVIVLEASSFQLLGTENFHPKASVLLNLFDAHLDYHGTKEEYVAAKSKITANQTEDDIFVYNLDDPLVCQVAEKSKAAKLPFSTKEVVSEGVYVNQGSIYFKDQLIIALSEVVLPGSHNVENILAAVGAAMTMGAKVTQIQHVLKTFSGVEHRLQFVKKINDRLFYNDSKATNILAAKKALEAFSQPVILLAGGLDRGNEFDELASSLSNVKALVAFGETKEKLARTAKGAGIAEVEYADRVKDAVECAYRLSEEGDVILLSPACASWDQYKTFEERGNEFVAAVDKLK